MPGNTPQFLVLGLVIAALDAPAGAEPPCAVPGDRVHWIADYCMATLHTDDEIPAAPCISREINRRFRGDCTAKLHYKRALCEMAIERGARRSDLGGCLADPAFAGPTVRNGGVGNW